MTIRRFNLKLVKNKISNPMNIVSINKKFGTDEKCFKYLEKTRWGRKPICPYCGSKKVVKLKVENHRFHCYDCRKSFSVTVGTIFEDSRLPLHKWFLIVGLITNAKQGISAKEIQRNIGTTYKTAWYCSMRVRCAMIDYCNIQLTNIVEMDEAYLGGKPRYRAIKCTKRDLTISKSGFDTEKPKRGRGTCKTPIVAIVERRGKVVVKVIEKINSLMLTTMLKQYVKTNEATLMTDENPSYNAADKFMEHFSVNHSKKEYARGAIHTNTAEGFFSIVKNTIGSTHRKVSKKYLPFYLVSSQYIYNNRNYLGDLFTKFMKDALKADKSDFMNKYKPIKAVRELTYGRCQTLKQKERGRK